jgi:PAS domain S-box-containing protein
MPAFSHRITITLLAVLAMLAFGGIWLYNTQKQQALDDSYVILESIARLKVDSILEWRNARQSHASVMMSSRTYNLAAEKWIKAPPADDSDEDKQTVLNRFRAGQDLYEYNDALFVNTAGKVYFNLNPPPKALSPATLQSLAIAFQTGAATYSDLYSDSSQEHPQLDLILPYFTSVGEESTPTGAIIYQYDIQQLVLDFWPVSTRSAESLLVRRDGDSALFLNELRHQKNTALILRIPLSRTDVPAVMAVMGKRGVAQGKDYRGVKVLSVLEPVPGTSWYMVAKVDESEALSPLRQNFIIILVSFLLLVASTFTVLAVVWQRKEKAYYRSMFEAEATLRKSEVRYRKILDSLTEGCQIIDFEWRFQYLNATAIRHSGHTKEELLNHTLMEVYPGIEDTPDFTAFHCCMKEREPQTVLHEADSPDEGKSWYVLSIQPIPEGIFILSSDITEIKRVEKRLRESESRHRALSEHMIQGAFRQRADGQLLDVNPAALEMFGLTEEEFLGRTWESPDWDVIREDNAPFPGAEHPSLLALKTGKPVKTVAGVLNPQKDIRVWMEISAIPEFLPGESRPYQVLVTLHDISGRKQMEEEKERLQSQLLQSQKLESIGRLAGGVAHDFNNMLNVILGHVQLALESVKSDHHLYSDLEQIDKAALRSAELTNQLLAFARKQTIAPKVLHLNDTVGGVLKILQRLIGEDIDLVWMPGYNLWKVLIDPSQVDQILTNLAINARDAIKKTGRITIETENIVFDDAYCITHPDFIPGEYVLLAISDNGDGMDKDTLERIFEPFFTTKGVGDGSGLGLATVFGIVKQNKGLINVYSEPGHGSTFKIYFPRFQGEDTEAVKKAPQESAKGGTETILLVEDEVAVKNLAKLMLERLGYTVIAATAPGEAIRLIESHTEEIHLMIVDVVMPEMTGRDLAKRLHSIRPDLKLLYMSGYTADVIAHQGILDNDVYFIQKPFSLKTLAAKVRKTLDG